MARDAEVQAADAARGEAKSRSRNCPRCSGEGLCEVFDPLFDGRRMVRPGDVLAGREVVRNWPLVVAAHCTCAMGRWLRDNTDSDLRVRIPDLEDIFAGRSRFVAEDPCGEGIEAHPWFARQPDPGPRGGVVPVADESTHERTGV